MMLKLNPQDRPRVIVEAFVMLTVVFLATLIAFAWLLVNVQDLTNENRSRIMEIQQSRISSCQQTYRGIRKVFKPFAPPKPRTPKQQSDLDKFNTTIDTLVVGCLEQTKPERRAHP